MLKPLQGSGGAGVFFVSDEESPNLNQMIEALGRDGYIVAQENLPEAEQGDVRLFLMNGVPLTVDGRHAAFRRVNTGTDPRSNMRVGGEPEPVDVDDEMLAVAEAVRPKLLADGMFLVGLDIVGSKLMEVNVFSPGGLGNCETLYGVKFTDAVIDALEHKVDLQRSVPECTRERRSRDALISRRISRPGASAAPLRGPQPLSAPRRPSPRARRPRAATRLVLLRPAFTLLGVVAGHLADDFLRLALDVFHDALRGALGSTVVRHSALLRR